MNKPLLPEETLPSVLVPTALVRDAARFGGREVDDCLFGDLIIREDRVRGMKTAIAGRNVSGMVLPRLTECHVHLDKCHTISRMHGIGGDLRAAIDAQSRDRALWTYDDIRQRATRGLRELVEAGCGTVRSHVDWSDPEYRGAPLAWQVLNDLAHDLGDGLNLQLAALIGADDMADASFAEASTREVAKAGGVLGGFVLDHTSRREGIENAFRMATKHNLAVDFHVDEGLADGLNGLEIIADIALETGFEGPVLCGHACSLMNLDDGDLGRVADKLARAGIAVATLPTTNLFLQGRSDGTPDRRGLTRVKELRAAGVSVVVGTDNVRDAFCPLGRHDPRQSLGVAALAAHLDPPYGSDLPMISTDARAALGLEPVFVDGASSEDLIFSDAVSTTEFISDPSSTRPLKDAIQRVTA